MRWLVVLFLVWLLIGAARGSGAIADQTITPDPCAVTSGQPC